MRRARLRLDLLLTTDGSRMDRLRRNATALNVAINRLDAPGLLFPLPVRGCHLCPQLSLLLRTEEGAVTKSLGQGLVQVAQELLLTPSHMLREDIPFVLRMSARHPPADGANQLQHYRPPKPRNSSTYSGEYYGSPTPDYWPKSPDSLDAKRMSSSKAHSEERTCYITIKPSESQPRETQGKPRRSILFEIIVQKHKKAKLRDLPN